MKKDTQNNTLTALKGVRVGHSTHPEALTGCTLILFDRVLPVAYKSYGGAPGTIATENLQNGKEHATRDGLFIAGGSLNGLSASTTITRDLIEQGIGLRVGKTTMPAISGAIIWDLSMGHYQFDPEFGAEALKNISDVSVENGNVGAGTGASVGKFQYLNKGTKSGAMKTGVGSARINLNKNIMVCALSVVNALGNVINSDGTILAGNRDENKRFKNFNDTVKFVAGDSRMNTTISVVGLNVNLKNRENYEKVAHIAAQGQVRAINPAQTSLDGDTVFVFSNEEYEGILNEKGKLFETPKWPGFSVDVVGQVAAQAVQESIYNACLEAKSIKLKDAYGGVIPSAKDY